MNLNVVIQYYNYQEATQDAYDFLDMCINSGSLFITYTLAENVYLATVLYIYD